MTPSVFILVLLAAYALHAWGTWGIAHCTECTSPVVRELYSVAVFLGYLGGLSVAGLVLISLNLWGTPWIL